MSVLISESLVVGRRGKSRPLRKLLQKEGDTVLVTENWTEELQQTVARERFRRTSRDRRSCAVNVRRIFVPHTSWPDLSGPTFGDPLDGSEFRRPTGGPASAGLEAAMEYSSAFPCG